MRVRTCVAASAALVLAMAACSPQDPGTKVENQAPQVWLSAAPPEGSTSRYRVQLFWGGWDPDGEITGYEYLITDNTELSFNPADTTGAAWYPVIGNDSTFTFSADSLANPGATSQVTEFIRSHTFFIRAVDQEGQRSYVPAYRSFTARTLSPEVSILVPVRNAFTPAELPPISTYRWKATDYVENTLTSQEPDSVQVALVSTKPFSNDFDRTIAFLRSPAGASQWQPWIYYRAPEDSGKFWTTPPTEFGYYVFAVRAKDEAGAVTPVLDEAKNVRRVRVSTRITGPLMTLKNIYLGQITTTSCSTPLTILDLPAGVPAEFTVRADATFYGGQVSGYRYGWDIPDLDNPDQWEIDLTPFVGTDATIPARSFFFGTHTLTVEVVDNSGFCSRIEVKVNVIQFTLERNILIIDDYKQDENPLANPGFGNTAGRGVLPTDAEQDAFFVDMMQNLEGFDPVGDVTQTSTTGEVPLALLARYKSVIWNTFSDVSMRFDYPLLYSFIQYRQKNPTGNSAQGKVQPNLLALAMAAGGHIMICGQQPIQLVENRVYTSAVRHPLIFKYEVEGAQTGTPNTDDPLGDESFAYKELCLEVLDYGYLPASRRRQKGGNPPYYCPVGTYRIPDANSKRDDTMRGGNPLDPAFLPFGLRAEVTAPGKAYQPSEQGLDAEVYNPEYFRRGRACVHVPVDPRPCFQPIFGLVSFDSTEATFNQPVAFWTSAFADRIADVPGAVGAPSVVFGFAPVFCNPAEIRPAFEHIMFDVWKLPRKPTMASE